MEKHARGSLARSNREARVVEKEKRKTHKENRYIIILYQTTLKWDLFIHMYSVFWLRL